jgi:2-desacetyl-2-hydroxyethyl bacteriochlorophyllide A dehydrogenase
MKAAVCEEARKVTIKEVKMPGPGPDEALIKVKSAGICGSDVRAYQGKHPAVIYPVTLGHEFSGEIAALGEDVEGFEIGDGVIVEPLFPCGECPSCLAGDYNLCAELIMTGYQIPGAFAEYTVARSAFLYPKGESLTFDEAALVEPLAVAVHAVKRAGIGIGDVVAVLGAGGIGLLAMQVAKKAGATVVITDTSTEKLHLAADMGADYVLNADSVDLYGLLMAMTRDRGADVVLECAGTAKTLIQAIELVRKGGTVAVVGWTGNELDQIPMTEITMNEINLLGSTIYCRDFPTAIELAVSRDIILNGIISHEFRLSEVGEALEKLSEEQHEVIKGIVKLSEMDL